MNTNHECDLNNTPLTTKNPNNFDGVIKEFNETASKFDALIHTRLNSTTTTTTGENTRMGSIGDESDLLGDLESDGYDELSMNNLSYDFEQEVPQSYVYGSDISV